MTYGTPWTAQEAPLMNLIDTPKATMTGSDYLIYANIGYLIERHLEERSVMLDVHTRHLLASLRETVLARADNVRPR